MKNASDKAFISANPPQPLKKTKPSQKNRAPQKEKLYERIKLADG